MYPQHLAQAPSSDCCIAAFKPQAADAHRNPYHFPPVSDMLGRGEHIVAPQNYRRNLTPVGLFMVGSLNRRLGCPRASNFRSFSVLLPSRRPVQKHPSPNISKSRQHRFRKNQCILVNTNNDLRGRAAWPAPTYSPALRCLDASSNKWGSPC